MSQICFRGLSTWIVVGALLTPTAISGAIRVPLLPIESLMRLDVTYTEEAHIVDKSKSNNGAEDEMVSNFSFRTTAGFEQRVLMQPITGAGITFFPQENSNPKFSGAVAYNGELKRTARDDQHRPSIDEEAQISFAGVLSDDSASGVPDDNAAGIQFGIQSDLTGGCKGKRIYTTYVTKPGGEEKKAETTELNSCANSDELHEAAIITREPLNLDLRQLPGGKEMVHYASQFHVTSCNLNPQYCTELKASEAAANAGPNAMAMSDNWIGATTSGSAAQGFKINLTMFKELKVDGTWKRYLQMAASVTPVARAKSAAAESSLRSVEIADRVRAGSMAG